MPGLTTRSDALAHADAAARTQASGGKLTGNPAAKGWDRLPDPESEVDGDGTENENENTGGDKEAL